MEIADYIKQEAEKMVKHAEHLQLPASIANTYFYLALASDESVLAHGAIKGPNGTEYKIGTKKS